MRESDNLNAAVALAVDEPERKMSQWNPAYDFPNPTNPFANRRILGDQRCRCFDVTQEPFA